MNALKNRYIFGILLLILASLLISFFTFSYSRYQRLRHILFAQSDQKVEASIVDPPSIVSNVSLNSLAFGPQRHLFRVTKGSRLLIFLKDGKAQAAVGSGDNWKVYPTPLVDEEVQIVDGVVEKDELFLAVESKGRILFRKINLKINGDELQVEGWIFNTIVTLDRSELAHRPSIETVDSLPVVSWSLETERAYPKSSKVRLMVAKDDPSTLQNWCNLFLSICGKEGAGFMGGATEDVYSTGMRTPSATLLRRLSDRTLILWFFNKNEKILKRLILQKENNTWVKSKIEDETSLGDSSVTSFDISGVFAKEQDRAIIAFHNQEGEVTVLSVAKDGNKKDLSWSGERRGNNLAMGMLNSRLYLFFNRDGRNIYRYLDATESWSEEKVLNEGINNLGNLSSEVVEGNNQEIMVVFVFSQASGQRAIGVSAVVGDGVPVSQ